MKFPFLLFVVLGLLTGAHAESMRFKIARQYENNDELDKAVAEYRAGLLEDPRNVSAYLALAGISAKKNDYHGAIKHYQDALTIEPTSLLAFLGLGDAYERIGALEKSVANWRSVAQYSKGATAEQAEKKIESLMEKLRANEKIAEEDSEVTSQNNSKFTYNGDYFKKAKRLLQEGKNKEALAYWRKVLKQQPGNPGAYYFAGVNRYNLKEFDKAIYNFTRAFDYPEKGFNAYYYLGRIYQNKGNAKEAIAYFQKYLDLTKSDKGRSEVAARIEKLKPFVGQPENTVKSSVGEEEPEEEQVNVIPQSIKEIESGHHFVVHNHKMKGAYDLELAWKSYDRDKNFNQMIESLKQVGLKYHSSPNYIAAQFNLMNIYHVLGLLENAESAGQLLLNSDIKEPYLSATNYMLSVIYRDMEESEKAREYLSAVKNSTELGPSDAERIELSGAIAIMENNESEGARLLEKSIAIQKNPRIKDSLRLVLADQYIEEKKHKLAKKHLKEILSSCSEKSDREICTKAHYEIADLYYKDKIWNLAEKYYSKVVELYPDTTNTPWGYYQLGNVMRAKEDHEEAVKYYRKVMIDFPKSYWAEQARWKRVDTIWRKEYDFALEK